MYIFSWIPLYTPVFSIPMCSPIYPCICNLKNRPLQACLLQVSKCSPPPVQYYLVAGGYSGSSALRDCRPTVRYIRDSNMFDFCAILYVYMVDYLLEPARCLISFHHNACAIGYHDCKSGRVCIMLFWTGKRCLRFATCFAFTIVLI